MSKHYRHTKALSLTTSTLAGLTVLSGFLLASPTTHAASSDAANLSITVPTACSLSIQNDNLSVSMMPLSSATIGTSTIKSFCNDPDGLAVYAAGFTGDSYGDNNLTATISNNSVSIPSGVNPSPSSSQWNMTLTAGTGDYAPTIMNQTTGDNPVGNFTQPHIIPTQYTKVAYRNSHTDAGTNATGANFTATFNVYVAGSQPAGTYTGKVKFLLIHPNVLSYSAGQPATFAPNTLARDPEVPLLYEKVAEQSKGKNTAQNGFSWTTIDQSTSGVYEWAGKDGTDSTATDSNGGTEPIYFYRGILDTTTASYGSNGPADAYPNYVKLGNDTCWRIVRTTSTGGVKMIYNGTWTGTTCANGAINAQLPGSMPFNTDSKAITNAVTGGVEKTYTSVAAPDPRAIGYTYSNTNSGTLAQVYGTSGNDTTTNSNSSTIKQYIEDWYARFMTSYTSMLEGDAGYCNDRTVFVYGTWTAPSADSTSISTSNLYAGAFPRNVQSSTFNPILTCPRGKVDLYSYTSDAGNGNGQLSYPTALLTADETSIAGSGFSNSFSAYDANSFLGTGYYYWLLSPYYSKSSVYAMGSSGPISSITATNPYGVRPVISLKPETVVTNGTGIATDPWTVE